MGPMMNKVDMAYPGAPLIRGDNCKYQWQKEFNTLLVTCQDTEGHLVGSQLRVVQGLVKDCSIRNSDYQPALSISDFAKFYIMERTGSYVCCDYYEPGFGYLFTNCGGTDIVIDNAKLNSTKAEEFKNKEQLSGFVVNASSTNASIWNFTELGELIQAKCDGTYKALTEYQLSGDYELWMELDLPW